MLFAMSGGVSWLTTVQRLTNAAFMVAWLLVSATQLSRSLDFLDCHRELIEWYGDEFPLEFNPFMLSKSLVDKAEGMGLQLATSSVGKVYSLRAAVRLKERALGSTEKNWWTRSIQSCDREPVFHHEKDFFSLDY